MTEVRRSRSESLITGMDLAATFVFALEGSITATYYDINVLGVVILGFTTALAGGIVRDVLIGCTPPASLSSPTYPVIAFAGSLLVIILDRAVSDLPMVVLQVTDAIGLSLFAVVGALKALDYGINGLVAVLLGTISACGGGVVRDMMLNIVPSVMTGQIYASAALAGAATTVLMARGGGGNTRGSVAMWAGFAVCLVIRLVSAWQGWALPHMT